MSETSINGSNRRPHFRRANFEDVIHVARLLRDFYRRSGSVYQVPYDHESAISFAAWSIANTVCLVGETSCASAILVPFPYNREAKMAQVSFWYFHRRREMLIFKALAEECAAAGATHINAASLQRPRADKFYVSAGMRPAEIQFMGPLNKVLQSLERGLKAPLTT